MRLMTGVFMSLMLGLAPHGLSAQGKGKGKQVQSNADAQGVHGRNGGATVTVSIGSHDVRIIREWFSNPSNMRGLPPGLAKRDTLPPGLQKQLVKNGRLPPGLQKKIHPLPPALEIRLTPLPEGRRRVIISGSVILLDQRNNFILDMVAVL